jgi:chromosome segregation ATPase
MVNNNNKKLSNNKKILQEQVVKLNNEIEELQLEREESKKNVLHFMQEADSARQELKKTQELIDELTSTSHLASPPPEKNEEVSTKPKISDLLSRLSLLDETKLSRLFELLHQDTPCLEEQLNQAQLDLNRQKSENALLQDELDQIKQEYQATRGALTIENERAEIIEKRWKESEYHLEQAESTIQQLSQFRQQHQECGGQQPAAAMDHHLADELCKLKENYSITVQQFNTLQSRLEEKEDSCKLWQTRHTELLKQCVSIYG